MVRQLTKATLDTVIDMFERHQGSTAELLRDQFSFIYQHIVEDRRRREVVRSGAERLAGEHVGRISLTALA
jgi:hypothetical protein